MEYFKKEQIDVKLIVRLVHVIFAFLLIATLFPATSTAEKISEVRQGEQIAIPSSSGSKSNKAPDWLALISVKSGSSLVPFCTGVLVSKSDVLTSKKCLSLYGNSGSFNVTLGVTDLGYTASIPENETIEVDRIIVKKGIVSLSKTEYEKYNTNNDLAILKLKSPSLNTPVLVSKSKTAKRNSFYTKRLTAYGYGLKDGESFTMSKTAKFISLVGNNVSGQTLSMNTFSPKSVVCPGDSGGPVLAANNKARSVPVLVGILSKGDSCIGDKWALSTTLGFASSANITTADNISWIKKNTSGIKYKKLPLRSIVKIRKSKLCIVPNIPTKYPISKIDRTYKRRGCTSVKEYKSTLKEKKEVPGVEILGNDFSDSSVRNPCFKRVRYMRGSRYFQKTLIPGQVGYLHKKVKTRIIECS